MNIEKFHHLLLLPVPLIRNSVPTFARIKNAVVNTEHQEAATGFSERQGEKKDLIQKAVVVQSSLILILSQNTGGNQDT